MTEKWSFRNAAEFREIFGTRECGNGNVARRNKILLESLKDKDFHKWLIESGALLAIDWCKTASMTSLNQKALLLLKHYQREMCLNNKQNTCLSLNDSYWWSPDYRTDDSDGVCEDGSYGHIRYVRKDNGKVYKMKAGKMFRHIIENNEAGKHFPEVLKTWLCEQFAEKWRAYSASKMPKAHLSTDVSFADIYGNGNYRCESMGSCMNGTDQHYFYEDSVNATPAALISEDGRKILARCVIFNEVRDDDTGEIVRLAERQYSRNSDESLKRQLVLSLINEGLIDGYKAIGADCHNARAYVSKDDEDWSFRRFSIKCNLSRGDCLSYQDSFKWYEEDENRAYNYSRYGSSSNLDTTDSEYEEEGDNYDEYHERYTRNDLVWVWVGAQQMYCDEECLDDFICVNEEWHHNEDVACCEECDEYYIYDDGYYSELTEQTYCSDYCRHEAERYYKQENWSYSDYDRDYFEEVETYWVWNAYEQRYVDRWISLGSLEKLLHSGRMLKYKGEYYLDYDAATRLPLDVLMEVA